MLEKIKIGLQEKEFRVFLVFLFFSTLIWFITKLSNTFEGDTVFNLAYENVPDDQMLMQASHEDLEVKLDALGFHFLGMSVSRKKVQIDLSNTKGKSSNAYLLKSAFKKQIAKQLPSSMKLIELMPDTLFFEFQEVLRKKVPVKPKTQINLAQNYMLNGGLVIQPDSVTIVGPVSQVDTITSLSTKTVDIRDLTSDFSKKVTLDISDQLSRTKFSDAYVTVGGRVSKFSEKKISLPIKVINLPKNKVVKTFPETVEVVCLGTLSVLKKMKTSDFQVVADYSLKTNRENRLSLILRKKPEGINSVILEETTVEYILKQKQ